LGADGQVDGGDWVQQAFMNMRCGSNGKGLDSLDRPEPATEQSEPALNVTIVYQDPLTHQWATELWERVEPLISGGRICCKSWNIGRLAEPLALEDATQAAAEADVLVISVRAAGDLPLMLGVWIDAWVGRRAGHAGALVALIGLPARPDARSSRVHQYFQAVARQAGLDFLPRERRLPEEANALPTPPVVTPAAPVTAGWGAANRGHFVLPRA
jgi:hypothetical protein